MDIAIRAMNTLLPKIAELLVGEYKLQKGVKGEIKELQQELASINAALCKVSKVPAYQHDELVKIWACDVRELSYDIEDVVDTFILQGQGYEHTKQLTLMGLIDRATNLYKKAKNNHLIHNVFKDIMDQVKKASERSKRYTVEERADRPSMVTVDTLVEVLHKELKELVGLERPKKELAKRLMDEGSSSGNKLKVISIVGFGGLGKTTLANAVLQTLKAKFDCHVFVSVSLNPDIKMILKNILGKLDKSKYAIINEAWDVVQLINEVIEFLQNKRCLCVIDDVWNGSVWDTIKFAFQNAKHYSKIVITTRNKAVAEHVGGGIYELKPLSDDDSRKLLNKRIFRTEDGCPPSLRQVSKKILNKCGGIPLAIITTASLLASKPMHSVEWEKVNNSIGSGLEKSPDVDNMKKILSLSYNDLPFHLKTCMLSLSKYPEDMEIRKDILVWSWIAEGFITQETAELAGRSLQEIGESYFNELINRSLIQPVDIHHYSDQDGQVHACQIHDMILELINQLSAEEGFVTTISAGKRAGGTRISAVQMMKIRRLSLHNGSKLDASKETRDQFSKVRSLAVFGKLESLPSLSTFHVLRVLQLEDCTGLDSNHLNDISKLRHLKFLRLGWHRDVALPESIGKLESLETMDIRGSGVVLLPMSFVRLRKLVRLFADEVRLPDGLALGDMKSLQKIVGICFTPEVIKEISNLTDLRVLRIFVNKDMAVDSSCNFEESILMCLQRCTNLQDLGIETDSFVLCTLHSMKQVPSGLRRFMCRGLGMTAFPRWIMSSTLSCLTTLYIQLFKEALQPQHLEKLSELPSLRFLRLVVIGTWKVQKLSIPSGACAFRCLRYFYFYCPSMFLTFPAGAMPGLQRLCLWFKYRLERKNINDFGLENLHALRHVIIECIGVEPKDRQEADAAIRKALKGNPNHPILELFLMY